ncbi:hypothetical protein FA15DRAFT_759493 [Coprinopsis marcescibilis]|uniref:F-box domain-containing protein n=1 Tax=Coprinopsis marcescibilis TaxID=230819 RepID=A0A5C3KJD8_COPMA|nr:hypothetical protein FA15DRAFT_759493 [Coprinopsis marcescibilis]
MNADIKISNTTCAVKLESPQASSQADVLANQELLATIFQAIWDKQEGDAVTEGACRVTLLHAALTCKAFYEPAMDYLWASMDDLTPLLTLIPSVQPVDQIYYLLSQDPGMDRFHAHARRLRSLKLLEWTDSFSAQFFTSLSKEFRQSKKGTFTKLKSMEIFPRGDTTCLCVTMLLEAGSPLTQARVTMDPDDDNGAGSALQCMLKLGELANQLERMEVSVVFAEPEFLFSIGRVLTLPQFKHPRLRTLIATFQTRSTHLLVSATLNSSRALTSLAILIPATVGRQMIPVSLPHIDWSDVSLELSLGTPRSVGVQDRIVEHSENLTSLHIDGSNSHRMGTPWGSSLLNAIACHQLPRLRKLVIGREDRTYFDEPSLLTIVQVKSLQELKLTGFLRRTTGAHSKVDTYIQELMQHCSPNLRLLCLPLRVLGRLPFTLQCLTHVAESRTNLSKFCVPLDSSIPIERFPWVEFTPNSSSTTLTELEICDCRKSRMDLVDQQRLATFLHRLFPNLQRIIPVLGCDAVDRETYRSWMFIDDIRRKI